MDSEQIFSINKRETAVNIKRKFSSACFRPLLFYEFSFLQDDLYNIVSQEFYQYCERYGMNRSMVYEPVKML